MRDKPWEKIFLDYGINDHNFSLGPFKITAEQIKKSTRKYKKTGEREVRILCKQDHRDARPKAFKDKNLFILPTKNKYYSIVQGEGYVDIPKITTAPIEYEPKLLFKLKTSEIGHSEMQHLDYAYAVSIIRTFIGDFSLVLTIRGRKYSPKEGFTFKVGDPKMDFKVESVQTEVDAGYEGEKQVILVEAKSDRATDVIIRQLYYPFRQWGQASGKKVRPVFFEKHGDMYLIWEFGFKDINDYNSIYLVNSASYKIKEQVKGSDRCQ